MHNEVHVLFRTSSVSAMSGFIYFRLRIGFVRSMEVFFFCYLWVWKFSFSATVAREFYKLYENVTFDYPI